MSETIQISVPVPLDEEGMIGRECLECKRYFKLKPGTGLPTDLCHCPYCEYEGKSDTFWTEAQLEYAKSIGINEVLDKLLKPSLNKLTNSFKDLERKTRNSLIQFKVKTSNTDFSVPIKYYKEQELETKLTCDKCGLTFAVYGVFARCPDCNEINAFLIYEKSLEVTKKQLDVFSKQEIPKEIQENSFPFILSSCISAFDGLGKEVREKKVINLPDKPKNLFQNLSKLDEVLDGYISANHSDYSTLLKMFQVRHIYEHNMGVIDNDFITKIPEYSHMLGRKYQLADKELSNFIDLMGELGGIIKEYYKKLDVQNA